MSDMINPDGVQNDVQNDERNTDSTYETHKNNVFRAFINDCDIDGESVESDLLLDLITFINKPRETVPISHITEVRTKETYCSFCIGKSTETNVYCINCEKGTCGTHEMENCHVDAKKFCIHCGNYCRNIGDSTSLECCSYFARFTMQSASKLNGRDKQIVVNQIKDFPYCKPCINRLVEADKEGSL